MTFNIELVLFGVAILLFFAILASKISGKIQVPALLLFLIIGMLAGSDGIGGIYFDDYKLTEKISIIALILILFSGGIESKWSEIKPNLWKGLTLSTAGVFISAIVFGIISAYLLSFSWKEGLLLGSIVASTDAPTVFAILRSRKVGLKPEIQSLVEFESSSNDPMAILLTVICVELIISTKISSLYLAGLFIWQIVWGLLAGFFLGKGFIWLIKKFHLEYEGLYPIMTIAFAFFVYATVALTKGSGFLAVYVAGIIIGNGEFLRKRSITRFHNSLSWLMQIVLFLTLGLLVFPKQLIPLAGTGLILSLVLFFIARPASIFVCLIPFKVKFKEMLMLSWVGIRGAVPIVMAIIPLTFGIPKANVIFDIVFIIVMMSILVQGTSIPWVAKLLKVDIPLNKKIKSPIEFEPSHEVTSDLLEYEIHDNSNIIGKTIQEIKLPKGSLIVLIGRNGEFIQPEANTIFESGDTIHTLAKKEVIPELNIKFQ